MKEFNFSLKKIKQLKSLNNWKHLGHIVLFLSVEMNELAVSGTGSNGRSSSTSKIILSSHSAHSSVCICMCVPVCEILECTGTRVNMFCVTVNKCAFVDLHMHLSVYICVCSVTMFLCEYGACIYD